MNPKHTTPMVLLLTDVTHKEAPGCCQTSQSSEVKMKMSLEEGIGYVPFSK